MKTISVIVPVYNTEAYLDRCIKSLFCQSYADLEIILVDDGSKDGSLRICREWEQRESRIQVISQPNLGVSSARNEGIRKSTGDLIMLLDSDDWLAADACEKLLALIKGKNADCIVCGLKQTSGNIWAPAFDKDYSDLASFKCDFIYWINTELLSSSVNKIYKRGLITELYPENMSFGEDLVFVLNYLKHCNRISFTQEPLYQHEVYNSVSLTHSFSPARFSNLEDIQKAILDFADDKNKINPRIYDKYVKDALHLTRMWYKNKNVPYIRKKEIIGEWLKQSYIRKLKISDYQLHWKDRMLLHCLHMSCFIGINLIVNGKEYINSLSKE